VIRKHSSLLQYEKMSNMMQPVKLIYPKIYILLQLCALISSVGKPLPVIEAPSILEAPYGVVDVRNVLAAPYGVVDVRN
jgi:hypothetical protein